jgi:hypothetical protein
MQVRYQAAPRPDDVRVIARLRRGESYVSRMLVASTRLHELNYQRELTV